MTVTVGGYDTNVQTSMSALENVTVTKKGTKTLLDVSATFTGLINFTWDYVSVAYPDTITEVYTYKTGGSGGTTVATVTIVYTDTTKSALSTVTKT